MSARSDLAEAVSLMGKAVERPFRLEMSFYARVHPNGDSLVFVELVNDVDVYPSYRATLCIGRGPDEEFASAQALGELLSGRNLARRFFPACGSLPELKLRLAVKGEEAAYYG